MSFELGKSKDELLNEVVENVKTMFRKSIKSANTVQIYQALAYAIKDSVTDKWIHTHEEYVERDVKLVYYLSMEFLMGRFLGDMLINLKLNDTVNEVLEELGVEPAEVEDAERDPGLGNGGLERLAACFLDSLSTLGSPAHGCGVCYPSG
ncbi:MAG: glycogen/starch/alpha-glucan phosphorylase, partial [Defluviitaleaceae bacterium]|nr:glycogen/starch/alpha-glucan phosphorylase [Defluviitaleaceae bacterium]